MIVVVVFINLIVHLFIHACWLVIYNYFIYFRFDDDGLELNKCPRMSG